MNSSKRSLIKQLGLAITLGITAVAAPLSVAVSKPLMVVVPFGPGGSSDLVARHIGQQLSAELDRSVLTDNRPGATGAIGAAAVARAAPDGNTMLLASIGVFAINPVLQPNLSYNPQEDFMLLTEAVRTPNVLVTHPSLPVDNVAEFIEILKQKPGVISFASGGTGSSEHLNSELFWQQTGTEGLHVPYKGAGQAVSDLLGGHADAGFINLSAVSEHVKSGKLKALAITSETRDPSFPDLPTTAEAGISGLEVYSWQGVALPRNVDPEVASTLHEAVVRALRNPQVKQRLTDQGFEVVASSQEEFEAFVEQEQARWKKVIEVGNISID